ncbi:hypothetical protein EGW08_022149 [Elysia chlorotica]|uniref:Uncharacterized protein n=1 Tax=Elysia chlorotica TaxID=188477 RepID=A0A433SLR8_ELYCH|nr:hypothetical protein EGW08_022149 [Elysia chlorotica]
MLGNMISVAYTDVAQMLFILVGLFSSLPFVLSNEKVGSITEEHRKWLGSLSPAYVALWCDLLVAMSLGTIPWQAYFQRVLSMKSSTQAQVLSFVGALGALVLAVPPALLGIAGSSADWSNTTFGVSPVGTNQSSLILPLVIHEFTPELVSLLGLGAISAAVMSSMDSSVLATSSMFTHNIYHEMFRLNASKRELGCVQVFSVVFFGCVSMAIAIWSSAIYGMFILAADIVFVTVFPQLTAVLFLPKLVNRAGACAGFCLGLVLRLGAGEPILGLPTWIYFPCYSEDHGGQLFPFRTSSMLASLATMLLVSAAVSPGRFKWVVGRAVPVTQDSCDDDLAESCGSARCHTTNGRFKLVVGSGQPLSQDSCDDDLAESCGTANGMRLKCKDSGQDVEMELQKMQHGTHE